MLEVPKRGWIIHVSRIFNVTPDILHRTLEEFLIIQRIEGTRIFPFETEKDLSVWYLISIKHYVSKISYLYIRVKKEPILRNSNMFEVCNISPKSETGACLLCSQTNYIFFCSTRKKCFDSRFPESTHFSLNSFDFDNRRIPS